MKLRTTCCLLLALLAPALVPAQTVLLLSTGSTTLDNQTRGVLQNGGATVIVGSQYPSLSATELAGIDVVLLLPNNNWSGGDMPLGAQNALATFVNAGGGLVTAEWTNWKVGDGKFANLQPILPVVSSTQFTSGTDVAITYTRSVADTVINAGLPASFSFKSDNFDGIESVFVAKPGATVFYTSSGGAGGAGLVGWESGAGRVLQFSTTLGPNGLADDRLSRLFQNSVQWAAVPEPSTYLLMALGLGVLFRFSTRRR